MARIKIEDLPVMEDMDTQELKGIFGGFNPQPEPPLKSFGFRRRSIRDIGARRSALGSVPPNGAKAGGGQKGWTFSGLD